MNPMIGRFLLFFLVPSVAVSAPTAEALLRDAASSYRKGDLLEALDRSVQALSADPRNAVAKNYVWTITQDLQKKEPRLRPGETERTAATARRYLAGRRKRTEEALTRLRDLSRRSGDMRSPTGLLTALRGVDPQTVLAGGAEGRVYMDAVLKNLQATLDKNAFVSRKDHLQAQGYMAYHGKEWDKAVSLWEKALREDPSDGQLRNDLESLRAMLKFERRQDRLKDLVSQAETFQRTGLYAQAVEAWREVLKTDPNHPQAVSALAASRVALEKTSQLKKLDGMNEEAAEHFKRGNYLKATEIWLEALRADPTYDKARVWLKLVGKKLQQTGDSSPPPAPLHAPSQEQVPTDVTPQNQAKAEQLYKTGLVAYAEGRLDEANDAWRQALKSNPSLKKAQEALKQGESELSLIRR